jgi:hypothetical protein
MFVFYPFPFSMDPTEQKEVMTKTGLETLKKIAQV